MQSDTQTLAYACLSAVLGVILTKWLRDPLRNIPTVGGPSLPFLSLIGAFNFMCRMDAVLGEGYKKYNRGVFKVAMLDKWVVFVSSREAIEDIGRRPEHELSVSQSTKELFQTDYTVAREVANDLWHVDIIRSKFGRDLASVLVDLVDELPLAVDECFPAHHDEFGGDIKAAVQTLVARLSGRICVGIPTCRIPHYPALVLRSSQSLMKDALIIKLFPQFSKPIVASLVTSTRSSMLAAIEYIEAMYRRRKEQLKSDAPEKPNDVLQWFIDGAPSRASMEDIIHRVLAVHIAGIHTSSTAIAQALNDLASYPQHMEVLRAEVGSLVAAEGWTKAAIDKMRKLDSFLKESQRCNCVVPFVSLRKAMDDLSLVDGTFLPKGTLVAAAASPIHHDETFYPRPGTFDPFRFSRMFDEEGPNATQRFTHSSTRWLTFGHGKHACPGRFFAADMVKAVIAHMLLNYDLKLEQAADGIGGGFAFSIIQTAKLGGKLMLKKCEA